ncbi:MAG TPA: hypothetical protein EYP10_05250 [Armatimonadetes bacterium]|nr:hypothetical protein [Armatimonadota bacterium]
MTVDMVNELDNRNHRNGSSHAGDNLQLSLVQHLRAGGQLRIAILTLVRCEHCHNALDEVFANVAGVRVTRLTPDDLESEDASYHISIVIGHARSSIDVQALNLLRNKSDKMIAVGTCSTSTGIRALRAFRNITPFLNLLNISEDVLANLDSGSASAEHVEIDFEVLGCPINPQRATDIITQITPARLHS